MDSLFKAIDSQMVLQISAIAVAFFSIRLLFRILDVGLGTMLAIIAIAFTLQYLFGISPRELWFGVNHLPQNIARTIQSFI